MESKDKEDPLLLSVVQDNRKYQPNKRGRPLKSSIISFCPPPKSIVSKMLCEMREKKIATVKTLITPIERMKNEKLLIKDDSTSNSFDSCHAGIAAKSCDFEDTNITYSNHLKGEEVKEAINTVDTKHLKNKKKYGFNIKKLQKLSATKNEQQFTCEQFGCLYTTKVRSNMSKHKFTHTGEQPYLCDQCTFRTNFVNSLKAHRRIHSNERPFCCESCGYRCNSISNLKKHNIHRHSKRS